MNVETILTGAMGLLKERGRCFGSYINQQGELCVLGAIGKAGDRGSERFEEMAGLALFELKPQDMVLVEAARLLMSVVRPAMPSDDLSVEDLIELVGDWHDGPMDNESRYPNPPANSVIFAAMAEAARLAETTGARP